jgi:hypothetical protein
MIKKLFVALFILLTVSLNAQTAKELLNEVYKKYSKDEPLSFKSYYNLFKTFDSKELYQSYSGIYYKDKEHKVYMKINETEILNNKEVSLKISHEEKAMIVGFPEINVGGAEFDMLALLEIYKSDGVLDKKTHWELTLKANQIGLPHGKIVLHIGKDYFLKKQIFYYDEVVDFSKDYTKKEIHQPRLEIAYSAYTRDPIKQSTFKTSRFLQINADGSIQSHPDWKHYELIDNRYN